MRAKTKSKLLKRKAHKPKRMSKPPRTRHFNEQETDFGKLPEDEGRMANLTSVRHGSGYGHDPEGDIAA